MRSTEVSLPPGIEIRNCILLSGKVQPGLLRRPGEIGRVICLSLPFPGVLCERIPFPSYLDFVFFVLLCLCVIPLRSLCPHSALLAHIGNVHRFHSAKALVAFFGLDPLVRESGDLQHRRHISKRGPGMVRRVLYMQCLSMCSDPDHSIGRFYARLTKQGKPHYYAITACMRKLTVILYAMLRSGNAFDPNYEDSSKALKQSERDRGRKKLRVAKHARTSLALDVPISTREAKRRKRIIALQNKKREGPHVSCDTSAGSCPKNLNEVTFPWYNVALS